MTDERMTVSIESRTYAVPEWLGRAPISSNAKVAYLALQAAAMSVPAGAEIEVGRKDLAEWLHKPLDTTPPDETSLSPSSVSRATTELDQYGAVTVRRETQPAAGPLGRIITTNRYFVRTTDPRIAHVKPSNSRPPVAYPLGRQWPTSRPPAVASSKGLEELSTTTNASETRRPRSFKAVVVEISEANQATLGDLLDLAAQLRQIRRNDVGKSERAWSDVNVARAVVEALDDGYDVELIRPALVHLARDPETIVPQRLKVAGKWWDQADIDSRRARKTATATERDQAIANCPRCDDYGWEIPPNGEIPDAEVRCDHTARTAVC